jgi:tetratricopeptide (TPR) repeat protein
MKSDLEDKEVQCFMGHLYGSGHGVLKNEYEAVKWYRKAAEQGHRGAQVFLGVRYANGQGVVKDEYQAIKWFRKAADLGNVFSSYKLGEMYENGSGVSRDVEEAKKWYRKAAEKGDQNAKKALERLEKENVRVIQPVQSIGPVSLPPQHQTLIDRPYDLQFCRHCRMRLSHLKKISRSCPQCGKNLFGR